MKEDKVIVEQKPKSIENIVIHRRKQQDAPHSWFYSNGTRRGIVAGILMGLYLVILQGIQPDGNIALKFLKYLILAAVIFSGMSAQKAYLNEEYRVINGIKYGAYTTFVAALTMVIINFASFMFTDTLAFDKFTKMGNSWGNVSLISGALFFEILVFGMISMFITLQFIKPKRSEIS